MHSASIDPSSWVHVGAIIGNGPSVLLPNIRSFSVQFMDTSEVPPMRILLSPSVSEISLKQNPGANTFNGIESHKAQQAAVERLLLEAVSVAPGMNSFKLICDRRPLSSRMASILARASSLRTLDLWFYAMEVLRPSGGGVVSVEDAFADDMNTFLEAFRQLHPLQKLETLILTNDMIKDSVIISDSTNAPPTPFLPRLRELVISPGRPPLKLVPIFRFLRSAELQRLAINKLYHGDASAMRQLYTTMVRSFPSLSSVELTITRPPHTLPDLAEVAPLRRALAPLFQLASLVSVVIKQGSITPPVTVADEDVDVISTSWPRLQFLSLSGLEQERTPNGRRLLSISSLISLATGCPQLKRLTLPLVDLRARSIQPVHTYPVLDHPLHCLALGRMASDDCSSAARILDRLFPHLDVTSPLLKLSARAAGPQTTAEALRRSGWGPLSEYNLSLAIATCQDARREDPWLSFATY
ncbi:hypothetical protein BN946_scf184970.g32 [Trametes cinnabarina]|uniref:F-box domain-containing protein n=1 Tax=Pycnoporus cinnabarinus TaxID=5643 RepID=A0A060SCU1_PYCCI|nr:hypothetical protein BN946_scf184970.g32 [Trametes cinnabarina]